MSFKNMEIMVIKETKNEPLIFIFCITDQILNQILGFIGSL